MSDKAKPIPIDQIPVEQIPALLAAKLYAPHRDANQAPINVQYAELLQEIRDMAEKKGSLTEAEACLREAEQSWAEFDKICGIVDTSARFFEAAEISRKWEVDLPIISPEKLLEEVEILRRQINVAGINDQIQLCFATQYLRGFWQSMAAIGGTVPDIPSFLDRDWRPLAANVEVQTLEGLRREDIFNACNQVVQYCEKRIKVGDPNLPIVPGMARTVLTDTKPQYVTLDQMAARVNRTKKTLEKKLNAEKSKMPKPDVEGGGGKPHEWIWANIRPWLETEFGKKLPPILPSRRADGN